MTNIEMEIRKKRHDFLSSYGRDPEFLYLGKEAYRALMYIINESLHFTQESHIKPYMGMKLMRVSNDDTHINCA